MAITTTLDRTVAAERPVFNPAPGTTALAAIAAGAVYLNAAVSGRQSLLFLVGAVAGVALYHAAFGFTASWRTFITERRGSGIRAQMLMLALTCAVFFPLLANGHAFGQTLRGSVSYMVPKVRVLISSALRSQPAILIQANMNVPNPVVQSLLGRLPPGGLPTGTTTVALHDATHRVYADTRRNQVDMRFAKVFHFGTRRADIGVDLQNLLNTNDPTAYESQYSYTAANGGTWSNPTTILGPRFVRLNLTFSF